MYIYSYIYLTLPGRSFSRSLSPPIHTYKM